MITWAIGMGATTRGDPTGINDLLRRVGNLGAVANGANLNGDGRDVWKSQGDRDVGDRKGRYRN